MAIGDAKRAGAIRLDRGMESATAKRGIGRLMIVLPPAGQIVEGDDAEIG
jgi:hypothetical protein